MAHERAILLFLEKAEKLKTIQRALSISDNSRKESPAEHSWRVALMALIFVRELDVDLDVLKALEIILVHDLVEAVAGDVWIMDQHDGDAHQKQHAKELRAAKELYALLPRNTGNELEALWMEYEEQSSIEAKFAKALDKIEVIVQRNNLGMKQWERQDIYPVLLHWADEAVANFPALLPFWKSVQDELTRQRDSL